MGETVRVAAGARRRRQQHGEERQEPAKHAGRPMQASCPPRDPSGRDDEVGHRGRGEQAPARLGDQARPLGRPSDARAVGGDPGVRVHLAVQLRDQHEGEARLQRLDALRPLPDLRRGCRSDPTRPACRGGCRRPTSPDAACRPSAAAPAESASGASAACPRCASRRWPSTSPTRRSRSCPGNGVSITNCAKVTPERCATSTVASNVAGRSLGRPKMNEPSTWTPWWRNARSRSTRSSPASLKPLWTSFSPSGVTDSTPTSAPLMRALLHRVEELGVLGRFHGDLREEHHVVGQLGEPRHQLEALGAHRLQRLVLRLVVAPRRHLQVGQRHRIEVVVGERDEAEAAAPQLDDLLDDRVARALARPLAVGLPHRAERAVLRAAADGLHRRPHVAIRRHQIPARRDAAPRARRGRRRRSARSVPRAQSSSTRAQTRSPSPLTTACAPPSSCASSGKSVA